jgi:hypothetical protein
VLYVERRCPNMGCRTGARPAQAVLSGPAMAGEAALQANRDTATIVLSMSHIFCWTLGVSQGTSPLLGERVDRSRRFSACAGRAYARRRGTGEP